jgi:hypothetical protein
MIIVNSSIEVRITEQTLKELLKAAEQARTNGYDRAVVRSFYCDAEAVICLDKSGNQESAGFKLQPRRTLTRHEKDKLEIPEVEDDD